MTFKIKNKKEIANSWGMKVKDVDWKFVEKIKSKSETQLPIYKIKGKFYFRDKRLGEYRNTKNLFDVIKEKDISLVDFQKPTKEDTKKLFGKK